MSPGRRPLTYRHLFAHVEETVETLRAAGLDRNDRIAVVLPSGPEMALTCVAVASGATCAPLNPGYRESEFEFYMSAVGAKALIVESNMRSPARDVAIRRGIPILELTPEADGPAGVFNLTRPPNRAPVRSGYAGPNDTAFVLHTSGTTARPKMVPLTHANIHSSGRHIATALALTAADRCLNIMPLFHIHGLVGGLVSSLVAGASVVCPPAFDADAFFTWMDACAPTWYTAVPTMHRAILERADAHREVIRRHPLRFIRSSSGPLPAPVLANLEAAFRAPTIESYGMTEASHQMTSNPLPPLLRKAGSVGVAAGPEVAIIDPAGNFMPAGTMGEIVVRGPNVMAGYDNDPTANETAFTQGWLRTGDQGRIDGGGYLYLTGRLKEVINRGGEKVSPQEVDDVLHEHPAVAQALAFATAHPSLGEDVVAAVVLRPGAEATERDIIRFASRRLADYKTPKQVLIVDDLPKDATGKPQRLGLADRLAEQLARRREAAFVAPETSVEKEICVLWEDLLGARRVGVHDSFYALGGDSLTTALMMAEVEERFQIEIPIEAFLTAPTIDTLRGLIQPAGGARTHVPAAPMKDPLLRGLANRLLQLCALYAPGYMTTRVLLHRLRGVSIGKNVSIGLSVLIESAYPGLVSIGNNVTIGTRVTIVGHLRDATPEERQGQIHTVRIEDEVYVGPGVIILPNVTIGRGTVVAAGSVVSRSLPPRVLARGNPAVPIAHCDVSLARGVPYRDFVRSLRPIRKGRPL
jgi:acyl-CoA synthetase (AMP-forming)/AMP-acid ligase II/acetyltransferase-like isoleucine patch superfamily enzyme/acyl carrier protein